MFDFSQLTDEVTNWAVGAAAQNLPLEGLLNQTGLDFEALQALPIGDAVSALTSAGVDVGALSDGQFSELLANFGGTEALTEQVK